MNRPKAFGTALLLAAGALAALAAAWRLTRTPEWVVLTGSEPARQAICRTVYRKSAPRAAWCLRRLLADRSPAVRLAALGALACRPDLHERFVPRLRELAAAGDAEVRACALEWLFQRGGMDAGQWLRLAAPLVADGGLRTRRPDLLAAYVARACEGAPADAVGWVLELVEDPAFEAQGALQGLLRRPDLLRPHRDRLARAYAGASRSTRLFLAAALAAIDGALPEAAGGTGGDPAENGLERFTVEAEWAQRIDPNFQIDMEQGELCIVLGEGAGGDHFWRRHEYSTVDIGKAFYTFRLARDGVYQIWCRCWFMDKCGNHSLLHIDERWLQWRDAGQDDRTDRLRVWHWKRIEGSVRLAAGRHTLTLTAGDDGLLYDKLAILPAGERFDPGNPPPLNALHDPAVPMGVSLTAERQAQCRGTVQTVTVWVRRTSPAVARGRVTLTVPEPFRLSGPGTADLEFPGQAPVAGAGFLVELPPGAVGGEVEVEAAFRGEDGTAAANTVLLGVLPDWRSTGPLDPRDARARRLVQKTALEPEDLREGWHPYPEAGCDRYRRLNFEQAYGQQQDRIVFLYTEFEVESAGEYLSLLTLDDNGFVFVDGRRVAGRAQPDVGEGWLMVDRVRLEPGRHRVFAWVYQADFPDPEGPDAGRHTPNHWVFKWLLREAMHRPARGLRWVPCAAP